MAKLPPDMLARGRAPDQEYAEQEELFRAFEPDALEGRAIAIDAIELPDLSVNRGKYGPPEWLLLVDRFQGCGVAVFKVEDIPRELEHQGVRRFTFAVVHAPTENNYPHSEIRAYNEQGTHIQAKERLDSDLHLRWRNRLRQRIRVRIMPSV